ncbi:Spectrin beta chain, non-erythrocytic 1 [Sparganum proliferum]
MMADKLGEPQVLLLIRIEVGMREWIAKRHLTASSHDAGTDLEHCFMLRSRFSDFVVETKHEGGRRMKTAMARCDGLIARGHPNRSEVVTCKDRLNEACADLLEMMDTRQQLLKSALDMHRFYSDAQVSVRDGKVCPSSITGAATR